MPQTVKGVIARAKDAPVELVDIVVPDPGPGVLAFRQPLLEVPPLPLSLLPLPRSKSLLQRKPFLLVPRPDLDLLLHP